MILVEVYGKADCALCDEVKAVLRRIQREVPFDLHDVDVEAAPELWEIYRERVPLVFVNGRLAFKYRVDEATARRRLADEACGMRLGRRLHDFVVRFLLSGAWGSRR